MLSLQNFVHWPVSVQRVSGQSFEDIVQRLRSVIINPYRSLSQPNLRCPSPLNKSSGFLFSVSWWTILSWNYFHKHYIFTLVMWLSIWKRQLRQCIVESSVWCTISFLTYFHKHDMFYFIHVIINMEKTLGQCRGDFT